MVSRKLTEAITAAAASFPVVTITGPRQSGKTTLVRTAFPDFHYVNLESADQRALVEQDPRRLLSDHIDGGLIVDETQRAPDLFSYVQTTVDEHGGLGRVILSGSQHFLLLEQITQSLAGRAAVLHLHPFTVAELPAVLGGSADEALFAGMYPPLHDRKLDPTLFYPTYIQTYIERDVRTVRNVGNLSTFSRFLRLCAGRVGSLLNLSALANEVGVDHKTVRSWLSVLEASFIVFLLPAYHRNFNKRIVKQPKLYFYDTGVVCSLLGIDAATQVSTHYLRGSIFENFVVAEYRKMIEHRGRRPRMYFWRDNVGTEVDLVIERGAELSAVEIKSGATLTNDFTRSLEKFQRYSGTPPDRSHLIYGGDLEHTGGPARIWPWTKLPALVDLLSG